MRQEAEKRVGMGRIRPRTFVPLVCLLPIHRSAARVDGFVKGPSKKHTDLFSTSRAAPCASGTMQACPKHAVRRPRRRCAWQVSTLEGALRVSATDVRLTTDTGMWALVPVTKRPTEPSQVDVVRLSGISATGQVECSPRNGRVRLSTQGLSPSICG